MLLAPLFKGGWGDLFVCLIRRYVKNDFKGNSWHQSSEDLQMRFGVIAATTPRNDAPLHVGEWANNAPRSQLVSVSPALGSCFGL